MADTEDNGQQSASPAPTGRKRVVIPLVIALVVLLGVAGAGAAYLISQMAAGQREAARQEATAVPETPAELTEDAPEEKPTNPIDFPSLKAEHPDIYAWISIPDTGVNYPIVQSATDDNFYLRRDLDGAYSVYGSIYTQSMNATDFSDPVTVVYGHNTENGTMFGDLLKFRDPDFFAAHEELYIYLPGHILTYRIIAAYDYDDRHILNSFDFTDPTVREQYFATVLAPTSMQVNVREGASLAADDRIVQLSTCTAVGTHDPVRYLVTGVLVDDQETQ